MFFEPIKLFSNLPVGMSDADSLIVTEQFKVGDFSRREEFIKAHTRIATTIALQYGFRGNRADDLVGVAMIELCKFPTLIHEGRLYNDKTLKFLLSRLHNACRDYISTDRLFGPSRGHINNTGVSVKREADDSPVVKSIGENDHSLDLYLDLKSLCKTRKEELVLDCIVQDMYDVEIKELFGWQTAMSVTKTIKPLFQRYIESILDDIVVWLPFPDFKSSVNCLRYDDLVEQVQSIKSVLEHKIVRHPASLMWRGYHYQLCSFGMYCADAIRKTNEDFDWFVRWRDKLPPTRDEGFPPWFDENKVHASHRSNLLRKCPEYYLQFGWSEKPSSNYYWPVLK